MTEEAMFRQAILTEPDDHVHRLVYADWLLENDPAREPLVRAQAVLGPSVITATGGRLVPIPAGVFVMGSPEGERHRDPDETAHEVTLGRPFYLGQTPVTVGEFQAFVEETGYETAAELTVGTGWNAEAGHWERGGYDWWEPGWKQKADEPVVCLAWEDAVAFCDWLSGVDGRTYRLPTEAEWEYACRAGTTTPFCFGETLGLDQANFDHRHPYGAEEPHGNGPGATTSVRSYPANGWGLFDMHGNVWEWCSDWYDYGYYERSRKRDPQGGSPGYGRVLRGGAWCVPAKDCRAALRRCGYAFFSRYHDGATGFRVALPMAAPKKPRNKRAPKPR